MATSRKKDVSIKFSLIDGVTAGLRSITKALAGVGSSLLKVTGIAGAATAALGAIGGTKLFGAAIDSAANLEEAIARIGAVTGTTTADLAAMRDQIRTAAEGAGVSTLAAAQAVEALGRAGLTASEAVAALGPAFDLSRAGAIAANEAAALLADTLDQFGLSGDDAARAADTLAAAALRAGTGVGQVTQAFTAAAPGARELGLSIEEAAAAVGLLAKEGIEGSKAGAALRNVFAQLQDPASKFRAELQKIGITSTDFGAVIAQLAAKGAGATTAIQALGTGGTAAVQALLRQGGPALAEFAALIADSGGAAKEAADQVKDSYKFALQDLQARLEDLKAELVSPILEPLSDEIGNLSAEVKAFVASEDFAKLQSALVTLFRDATRAAKEFVADVDFAELISKIATFAEESGKKLGELATNVSEVAGALETAFDGVGVAVDGLQVTVTAAGTVIATGVEKIAGAVAPVSEIAGDLERSADALGNTLGDAFTRNVAEVVAGIDDLRGATEDAGAATEGMATRVAAAGAAATTTATQVTSLADAGRAAGEAALAAAPRLTQFESVSAGVGDTVIRIAGQVEQVRDAFTRLQAAGADPTLLAPVQARIEALTTELEAAKAAADTTRAALQAAGQTALPQVEQLRDTLASTAQAAGNVADEGQRAGDTVSDGASSAALAIGQVLSTLQQLNERFDRISDAARELFVFLQRLGATGETSLFGFTRAMLEAAEVTQRTIDEQKAGLESLIRLYEEYAANGSDSLLAVVDAGRLTEEQMRVLADQVRTGEAAFRVLGDQDLDRLAASIERAADKSRALADETRRAAEQLAALNRELLDEADRNAGNEEAIARRQYEDRIRQIEALAQAAGLEGAQAAAEARRQAEENFKAELARIRARREEERKAHAERMAELDREGEARDASTSAGSGGVNRPATSGQSLPPTAPRAPLVTINLDGATIIGDPSPATLEKLAVPIGRILNQRAALRR